jgi:hypothetical protein
MTKCLILALTGQQRSFLKTYDKIEQIIHQFSEYTPLISVVMDKIPNISWNLNQTSLTTYKNIKHTKGKWNISYRISRNVKDTYTRLQHQSYMMKLSLKGIFQLVQTHSCDINLSIGIRQRPDIYVTNPIFLKNEVRNNSNTIIIPNEYSNYGSNDRFAIGPLIYIIQVLRFFDTVDAIRRGIMSNFKCPMKCHTETIFQRHLNQSRIPYIQRNILLKKICTKQTTNLNYVWGNC